MSDNITFALPKGRMLKEGLALLAQIGIHFDLDADSRRLVMTDRSGNYRFIVVRDVDLPTYVERGAADLGFSGKDVLLEQGKDLYEPLDMGIGYCRIVLAEPKDLFEHDDPRRWANIRIATKYPNITERYFYERGISVEVIKLYGSIELAPLVGLSERIVDLVSTGRTLLDNGLVEVATITDSTARLVVNRASMKLKYQHLSRIINELREVLNAG